MANFDKQYVQLTSELKEIIQEELEKQMGGEHSIFLLRQAGVDEYMFRSSRSREIQHVESLINRMQIILDKTGILREDCILSVLDVYRSRHSGLKPVKPKKKWKITFELEEHILELLKAF